ncbi:hypothetical protein AFV9_gp54 [Betalipothrixvirus uzonense]|uniref:DUF2341 domain-containing protein n=1 Tax=Betalipothrixvirus uzonense TaxID=512792 RepID=B2CRN1_9VIRU|nr:hypothetical protein AFV9_gp54 [Acidianus filamentous virus 9]ACB37288.1 hypothetical protein [Acidianus filamentous virus 9]
MSCGEFPNNNCVPTPNWECSDVECMYQCLNQPDFQAFYECCIQCALAHYIAEAKDHVTILISKAVNSINTEVIPVFDQLQIFVAHKEEEKLTEKVSVGDVLNVGKYPVKKYTYYENVQVNDIGQPCSSPTGFCVPPGVTASEELWFVNEGGVVVFPSVVPPTTTSTSLYVSPPPPTYTTYPTPTPITYPSYTTYPTTTVTPPPSQTTQVLVVSEPCPNVCPGCTCYYMLGIEIVDPTDAVYNYEETPIGTVEQVPQSEYVVPQDQLSLEEAPSHTTETESVEEGVSFVLSYLVTATLPVLEVSFIYPITLIKEIESITATRSLQSVYFTYPVVKQTFVESVTATSVSVLGYFQPPIKLVTESEVTSLSQRVLQVKFTKPITFYQSVPTSVTQLITTLDIIRTVVPEKLAEYTNAIRSVIDVLVFQIVTEVLKSEPTSVSEDILISQVFETVKKVLVPEVTSSTQEFLDSLIYQTVKEVVESVLTSQTQVYQVSYFSEKVTPTQISEETSKSETSQVVSISETVSPTQISEETSQTQVYQVSYFMQQVSPTQVSELSSQTEEVIDLQFVPCAFSDAIGQCYNNSYQLTIYNYSSITWESGYEVPLYINVPNANSTYSNIRFSYNGQELYSWVEYIDDGYAWVFIVLPTSISSGGSLTIDVWYGESDYVYDGVAGAYKEIAGCDYDNGDKVFIFYDNFCGTSVNTDNWYVYESGSVSVTVDNDLEITASSGSTGYYVLQTKNTFGTGTIFEVLQTAKTFNTNIRTASPAISSGSGVCYFSPDSPAVISGCSPSVPVMSWSINSNCYPWWMMESGYNNGACNPSCTYYIQTGINFPFSHRVLGVVYNPGIENGWYIDYVPLELGSGGANTMGDLTYNSCSSSCSNECVPSGDVYMYIGTAFSSLNGDLDIVFHYARVRYDIADDHSYCSAVGESSSNISELPSYSNYGDATYYSSGWDSCNDTQYMQLITASQGQYGGTVIPFSYTQGDIITVSIIVSATSVSSCPADGVTVALFLESPNTSSLFDVYNYTGCPCQGDVVMPTTSGTYFYVQFDPYCCATCGQNEGSGACFNVVVVNNNSVSYAVCHTGSGSFEGQNFVTGKGYILIITYDPSSGYVYFTFYDDYNNEIASGSVDISSYFSPPSSGTYYMVIAGSSSGQYGNWSFIRWSPRIW